LVRDNFVDAVDIDVKFDDGATVAFSAKIGCIVLGVAAIKVITFIGAETVAVSELKAFVEGRKVDMKVEFVAFPEKDVLVDSKLTPEVDSDVTCGAEWEVFWKTNWAVDFELFSFVVSGVIAADTKFFCSINRVEVTRNGVAFSSIVLFRKLEIVTAFELINNELTKFVTAVDDDKVDIADIEFISVVEAVGGLSVNANSAGFDWKELDCRLDVVDDIFGGLVTKEDLDEVWDSVFVTEINDNDVVVVATEVVSSGDWFVVLCTSKFGIWVQIPKHKIPKIPCSLPLAKGICNGLKSFERGYFKVLKIKN
jgi:hypothetical protein